MRISHPVGTSLRQSDVKPTRRLGDGCQMSEEDKAAAGPETWTDFHEMLKEAHLWAQGRTEPVTPLWMNPKIHIGTSWDWGLISQHRVSSVPTGKKLILPVNPELCKGPQMAESTRCHETRFSPTYW